MRPGPGDPRHAAQGAARLQQGSANEVPKPWSAGLHSGEGSSHDIECEEVEEAARQGPEEGIGTQGPASRNKQRAPEQHNAIKKCGAHPGPVLCPGG